MLKKLIILCLLIGLPAIASAASSPITRQLHTDAQLHSEYDAIDGKTPFYLLFHLKIDEHWHTYWKNTGDSGIPPNLKWTLPEGWKAEDITWQPPKRLPFGPLMNYGYESNAYHLIKIIPSLGILGDTPISVKADWLVCNEECIPESSEFNLSVAVGDKLEESIVSQLIRQLKVQAELKNLEGHVRQEKEYVIIQVPLDMTEVRDAYLFVDESGTIEPAAKQKAAINDGVLELTVKKGLLPLPQPVTGILEVHDAVGTIHHFKLTADMNTAPVKNLQKTTKLETDSLAVAILLALIGGIILNAMPCVFPVLSLKALSLSRSSTKERADVRTYGITYSLGVIAGFAVLGLALILLKLSGEAVGWGYQMQSPYFVAFLTYLLFLIGLNLAGYFDISFSMNLATKSEGKETLKGSFATGILVTLMATPCTAPFMATALGAALSQSPLGGMAIFIAMGFGLALPYLLLTLIPGALKWMPKPGAWMERFKQFLAFPMFLSAIWLIWVFMLETNAQATALLLTGLVLTVFALWLWRVIAPQRFITKFLTFVVLIALALTPVFLTSFERQTQNTMEKNAANPYNPVKLAALQEQGKPVFIYATAAWCITCKVNERVALNDKAVQDYFVANGITVMVADWTNEDLAITEFLSNYGRAGVPLYVYYPSKHLPPRILPQLLTPSLILQHLSGE